MQAASALLERSIVVETRATWVTPVALALIFAAIALLGTPFVYAEKNSGRYLLPVFAAGDAQLFPNDPVVASMKRFGTLFYGVLTAWEKQSNPSPETLKAAMHGLYIASKFALFAILLMLVRTLTDDWRLFVVFGAWCVFPLPLPVGGLSLFPATMTHNELAFLVGLAGLWALFKGKITLFWILMAAGVFIHLLVALQLVLCVLPALAVSAPLRSARKHVGILFFAAAMLLYLVYLGPPPMTAEEARLFVAAKGHMAHVSPFDQGLFNWAKMLGVLVLALTCYVLGPRHGVRSLVARFIGLGSLAAVIIGAAAVITASARLAQFQPMRTFLWITFFCNLLIADAAVSSIAKKRFIGLLLSVYILMSIVDSIVALPLIALSLLWILLENARLPLESLIRISLASLGAIAAIGWMLGSRQPLESLRRPDAVLAAALCLLVASVPWWIWRQRWVGAAALLCAMPLASFPRQASFRADQDLAWQDVAEWCRDNTPKSATFLTPPGTSYFRIYALRTVLNESSTEVAWVDPLLYEQLQQSSKAASAAYGSGGLAQSQVCGLARQWNAGYIIFKSGTPVTGTRPLYTNGQYSVFDLTACPLAEGRIQP